MVVFLILFSSLCLFKLSFWSIFSDIVKYILFFKTAFPPFYEKAWEQQRLEYSFD